MLHGRAQFQYPDQLDQRSIRLLDIKPIKSEKIIIGLHTYLLDCAPSYISLSYTWGDPNDSSAIICHGQTLPVTKNLEEALWQLKKSQDIFKQRVVACNGNSEPLYFWVDAICINQNDDNEKNNQVRLMWEIYSHADLVIAWLGKQNEATERGLDLVKKLAIIIEQRSRGLNAGAGEKGEHQGFDPVELQSLGLPGVISNAWDDFFSIFSRQWFGRVWIIQEFVAAKECVFLCGDDIIDSSTLLRVGQLIEDDSLLRSMRNFNRRRHLGANVARLAALKRMEKKTDILELLWSTHLFRATDPRDRVFALLHMAQEIAPDMISDLIDYRLDTDQVLVKIASLSLCKGSLNVLSFAQSSGDLYRLPSWVPYWTALDFSYMPLVISWGVSALHQIAMPSESYCRVEANSVSVHPEVHDGENIFCV